MSAVTRVLGASYAAAERAVPASPALFLESCFKTRPLPETLDIARAPSLVDLVRGFLGLQGGRAPGRSGLPAEVFSANPVTAALAYGPICPQASGQRGQSHPVVRGDCPLHPQRL